MEYLNTCKELIESQWLFYFQDGSTVYLIFSIQGSGHFQGYAIMSSCVGAERSSDYNGQGGVFSVDWVKRSVLFQLVDFLYTLSVEI
jgi:hypothetical protein